MISAEALREIEENLSFVEDGHSYAWKQEPTHSVTQILNLAGITDYSKAPLDLLTRAQKFGNAVHLAARYFDEGRLDFSTLDSDLRACLTTWKDFKIRNIQKTVLIEQKLYSAIGPYCGTLDRLYLNHYDELCLLEIKTSQDFMPGIDLQTAAYAFALERLFGIKIKRRQGVLIHNTHFEICEFKRKSDIDDFLSCAFEANGKGTESDRRRIKNYKSTKRRF